VEVDRRTRDLLSRARIGMLALNASPLPLVNPAAFHYGGGAVWITTSRHAVKLALSRRDPRAAFLVEGEGRAVVLQGILETFDPRSLGSQLRAVLEGPGFAWNLTGYALKNASYIGGYLLELASIPAEWWPHNRVVLRLRVERVRQLRTEETLRAPLSPRTRLPSVPAEVARSLDGAAGYLCWPTPRGPTLAPVTWSLEGSDALLRLSPGVGRGPSANSSCALVVERHHPYRATRMVGACLRGWLAEEPAGGLRLLIDRVTWWQGFRVRTRPLRRRAAAGAAT
jgi:hypothetical protein